MLNASMEPLSIVSAQRGLLLLQRGRIEVLEHVMERTPAQLATASPSAEMAPVQGKGRKRGLVDRLFQHLSPGADPALSAAKGKGKKKGQRVAATPAGDTPVAATPAGDPPVEARVVGRLPRNRC